MAEEIMKNKTVKTRISQKHGFENDWKKAVNFKPLISEWIIYDAEVDANGNVLDGLTDETRGRPPYSFARAKIGDGVSFVNELPFHGAGCALNINSEIFNDYVNNLAGAKAFTIQSVDLENKTYTLDSSEGLSVDDEYCVHIYYSTEEGTNDKQYDLLGRITAINGSSVTVDTMFGIPSDYLELATPDSYMDGGYDKEWNTFRVPAKPTCGTREIGFYSHAEGYHSEAHSKGAHAEGGATEAIGSWSHVEGIGTKAVYAAHAEGTYTNAYGESSHTEGLETETRGNSSHAEGRRTKATKNAAHAEGEETQALANSAHAEGNKTIADGIYTHAEGTQTKASGWAAHAEGGGTTAGAHFSHAEGYQTVVEDVNGTNYGGHAEGSQTRVTGAAAHAGGSKSQATAKNAFAHGQDVIANKENQTVFGKYSKDTSAVFAIGGGTSDSSRKNILEVDSSGHVTASDPTQTSHLVTKGWIENNIVSKYETEYDRNNFAPAKQTNVQIDVAYTNPFGGAAGNKDRLFSVKGITADDLNTYVYVFSTDYVDGAVFRKMKNDGYYRNYEDICTAEGTGVYELSNGVVTSKMLKYSNRHVLVTNSKELLENTTFIFSLTSGLTTDSIKKTSTFRLVRVPLTSVEEFVPTDATCLYYDPSASGKLSYTSNTSDLAFWDGTKYEVLASESYVDNATKIADSDITTNLIANYAVTSEKLAKNAVKSDNIDNLQVMERHLSQDVSEKITDAKNTAETALVVANGANGARVFDTESALEAWLNEQDRTADFNLSSPIDVSGYDRLCLSYNYAGLQIRSIVFNAIVEITKDGVVENKEVPLDIDPSENKYNIGYQYPMHNRECFYAILPENATKLISVTDFELLAEGPYYITFEQLQNHNLIIRPVHSYSEKVVEHCSPYDIKVGTNFYIKQTNVPDYWWDGFEPQILETQKVDLTNYVDNITFETFTDKFEGDKTAQTVSPITHEILVPYQGTSVDSLNNVISENNSKIDYLMDKVYSNSIKIGNTFFTEEQLIKIINFIDTISFGGNE